MHPCCNQELSLFIIFFVYILEYNVGFLLNKYIYDAKTVSPYVEPLKA